MALVEWVILLYFAMFLSVRLRSIFEGFVHAMMTMSIDKFMLFIVVLSTFKQSGKLSKPLKVTAHIKVTVCYGRI